MATQSHNFEPFYGGEMGLLPTATGTLRSPRDNHPPRNDGGICDLLNLDKYPHRLITGWISARSTIHVTQSATERTEPLSFLCGLCGELLKIPLHDLEFNKHAWLRNV